MVVHVFDPFYLGITALITLGWQVLGFAIAYGLQFDKITDLWGAINYFALALFTLLCGNTFYIRNIVASVFVMVWATRLGGFQLFRLIKMGKDTRFDDMRGNFLSFAGFWFFQFIWIWTVSLPTTILNSPAVSQPSEGGGDVSFGTSKDIAGIILWGLGFLCEALSDIQKYRFKNNKPPKGAITDGGLWYYSRRPNYFGEILLWWGMWILCLSPAVDGSNSQRAHDAQYGAIFSPLLTMALLLFLSGIPLAEKPSQKKYFLMSHGSDGGQSLTPTKSQPEEDPWTRMKAYRERTSILLPLPPVVYKHLPRFIKSTVLFDFPFYNFDEKKDGEQAINEEEDKQRSQQA